jgi:hypothetical protein
LIARTTLEQDQAEIAPPGVIVFGSAPWLRLDEDIAYCSTDVVIMPPSDSTKFLLGEKEKQPHNPMLGTFPGDPPIVFKGNSAQLTGPHLRQPSLHIRSTAPATLHIRTLA